MMLSLLSDTRFIGELAQTAAKVVTKIDTPILIQKHKSNGDYISEREVTVPPFTQFTVSPENGEKGFSVPSKSLYHNLIMLDGNLEKGPDESITFQEYKMTKEHFENHFLIVT